ncbi:SusC/RagA family TonB-linked outer membrane protein [Pedobacter sp. ASV1-7]|uniref:SusC/RagA family TonB-linked outer membrane protein n=1 Tax=Pedobacter sp. ASV1-7 TaxID=3145237 RepID=UPI0032E859BB
MKILYLKSMMLLLFCCTGMLSVYAQSGSVSGLVTDEINKPVPGAVIRVEGTTQTSQTDSNGKYYLKGIKPGLATISVSFVGYTTQKNTISLSQNSIVLNFKLQPANEILNEIIVIGYGTQKKQDLTGSITTVGAKDFQKGAITTPEQLIQGKVAGVNVVSNGGQPGGGSMIRIRGGASLNASNDPLIVIDGVPFSGNTINNAPNPLALINPADIESFTVLKDANATAIYGSRASNGVILITTKKGSSGAAVIEFNTNNAYSTIAKKVDVLSAAEIRDYFDAHPNATYGNEPFKNLLGTANTDWQSEIYENAFSTDNNLNLSGAFQGVPYRVSAGYLDQKGMLITDRFKRATGGLALQPKLFDGHLKIDLNLKGTLTDAHFANQGAIANSIQFDPTQAVRTQNDEFGGYYEWLGGGSLNRNAARNPVSMILMQDNNGKTERSFGNVQVDYSFHFLPELHANLNLGYDVSRGYGSIFVPANAGLNFVNGGFQTKSLSSQNNKVGEFYLNYTKNLKSLKSKIDLTAGYGYYDNKTTTYNFKNYDATGTTVQFTPAFPYDIPRNKLISYYGRLVYTFADKYILSGTMRADGSSRFAKDKRWGYFPSVGFTWKLNEENFLKDNRSLSDLKVRLSYGQTGNQDGIGNYNYLAKYYLNAPAGQYQLGDHFYDYYSPSDYDTDLTWESTTTYNTGLDYGFWGGRINGTLDVYYKETKNLLSTIDIPSGSNFNNTLLTNVGNMEVKGAEFNINLALIQGKKLNWDIGFNASYNNRKITQLSLNPDPRYKISAGTITGGTGNNIKYNGVGQVPQSFYVRKQIYDRNGKPLENMYADLNGDGISNADDSYFYKSPDPDLVFGLSSSVNFRRWTLSTVLRSNIGNYMYDNVSSNFGVQSNVMSSLGFVNNATRDILNTQFTSNRYESDYYVKNASFLKMDNLTLAFDAGKLFKDQSRNLRISAGCQNVFVITKYKGLDPEVFSGVDLNLYPRPRIYSLGFNVGF